MTLVIVAIVPLALGIAASPFPVVPAILLLFTSRPHATAGSFLAGWAVGVAVACGVFTALASGIAPNDGTPTWVSWTKLGLGVLLLFLSLQQWRHRQAQDEPAWMRALDDAAPARAFRLGLLLSAANPKVVLLAAAGGLAVGSADLSTPEVITTVVAFTVIASITVALPWLLYAALGDRMLAPLGRARDWLKAHNATVVALVLAVLGVLLVIDGLGGL